MAGIGGNMIDTYLRRFAAVIALALALVLAPAARAQDIAAQCEASATNPDCACVADLVAETPAGLQPEARAFLSLLLGVGSVPSGEAMVALEPEMDRLSDGYSRCMAGAREAARQAAAAEVSGADDAAMMARSLEQPFPPAGAARRAEAFQSASDMCARSALPIDCACLTARLDADGPQAGAVELDYMLMTLANVLTVDGPVGPDDLTAQQQLRVNAVESPYAEGYVDRVNACAIPDPQGMAAAEAAAAGTLPATGPAARVRAQCESFGNSAELCACEVSLMARQMGPEVFAVYGAEGRIDAIAEQLGIGTDEARRRRDAANAVIGDSELSDTRRLACVAAR